MSDYEDERAREKLRDAMWEIVRAGWSPEQLKREACQELAEYLREQAEMADRAALDKARGTT